MRRATILRIFNVYGPSQHPDFLVPHLIRGLVTGAVLPVGELDHGRDWLHVDDVAAAVVCALRAPPLPGAVRVLNVASGAAHSAREIVRTLEAITGRRLQLREDPTRKRPLEPPAEWATSSALAALGWRPRFTLAEGLAQTWSAWADADLI